MKYNDFLRQFTIKCGSCDTPMEIDEYDDETYEISIGCPNQECEAFIWWVDITPKVPKDVRKLDYSGNTKSKIPIVDYRGKVRK